MWQRTFVAATLAALSLYHPVSATALAVPELYQPLIAIVGWTPADVPTLVQVVTCESGWNSLAVGQAGELGLAQIHPETWLDIQLVSDAPGMEHWANPAANLYTARVIREAYGWERWSCYD
jgi:soluble lytic murein transglycosylase-like protein